MIHGLNRTGSSVACPAGKVVVSFLAVVVAMLAVSGCGKEEAGMDASTLSAEDSAALNQNVSPPPPRPAMQGRPRKIQATGEDPSRAMVDQLNRELARWIVTHRRVPSSFDEFVTTGQIQVPTPPPGKKFILNKDTRIELVKQ